MFVSVLKKIFGTKSQRDVRRMRPLVARINALEVEYQKLDEAAIKAKTAEFKARLAAGETLDDIACEAFAVVKKRLPPSGGDRSGSVRSEADLEYGSL